MPSLSPSTWSAEQNTKIPADTHYISYRVQLSAANVSGTFPIPTSQTNPAQATFPGVAPTGEPQQGRRMFVTKLVVRDATAAIGGTAGGSVALLDQTTGVTLITQASQTTAGANPTYVITTQVTSAANGAVNPNDQLAVVYTAPTAGTATGTAFTVDVFGYIQQGI